MKADGRVERVLQWRAWLATMENERFFDLIRMYLGEVKTPFNKQNLIESLSAFLRRDENKVSITSLLGKNDLKILTFIHLLPSATYESISSFFAGEDFGHSIRDHLENLIERLLIFSVQEDRGHVQFKLNPLLEESLEPLLGLEWLLDDGGKIQVGEVENFFLTPMFASSFISFVARHPELCKANFELKKKSCEDLIALYGASMEKDKIIGCTQTLLSAFLNLGLFESKEKGIVPEWENLEKFSSLDYYGSLVLLASSAAMHLTVKSLRKYSSVLLDLFSLIPADGTSIDNLNRLAFLISEKNSAQEDDASGRFEKLMARHESFLTSEDEGVREKILPSIVQNSINLGLLLAVGKDEKGRTLYVPVKAENVNSVEGSPKKVISVDTSLSVTIMPGLSLLELLPFARMMDICHFDVAAVYEMNRHSMTRYFDSGAKPENIIALFDSYSAFSMPQNLQVIVEEWFASYSSAKLYCGYVLRLSEHNSAIVEKNPAVSSHIVERLAPGVYLLDSCSDEEVQNMMARSGMEFTGKIKKVSDRQVPISYLSINAVSSAGGLGGRKIREQAFDGKKAEETLLLMEEALSKIEMPKEQREGLAERIERRIIVNPEQLRPNSVRFEKLEALAMDYSGKIHVVENALQTKSLVEIEVDDSESAITGLPLELEKTAGQANVTLLCRDGSKKTVFLSSARSVRKIREKLDY